ncbi:MULTISPECIES: pyruvate kinase [unclassified Paraburkholderia]|uniref:pyruvate kinase n=1 Tax=unclassified Paraburkholderia TaxID=2615204 RepID=UPI002AB16938|nr:MULTISPECIES: pyruvate kinase [unclassified Paraburkholderia]
MTSTRATKIIATLGPASSTESVIEALHLAGADVFRLNFSHGSYDDHVHRLKAVRRVEERADRPIAILLDLQGPKLRVSTFAEGKAELHAGDAFVFDQQNVPGNGKRVYLPHPEIFSAASVGDHLLVNDGQLRFEVTSVSGDELVTKILVGGVISDRKGVNVPSAALPLPALSDKDRRDLEFGLEQGVDWVALSFVQRPEDLHEARALIRGRAKLLAKVEKPSAVERIDEIIEAADAIMVARGDLGVEMPPEDVPAIQKRIVRLCREAGKPVVVATQMLESMVNSASPTRAEASDVATAVYDGADTVMLSAESASGKYPVEAVAMMNRILERTEADPLYRQLMHAVAPRDTATATDAIGAAIRTISDALPLAATVTYTTSGATALRVARERPSSPILGLTPSTLVARQLALSWGVSAKLIEGASDVEDMVNKASAAAREAGFACQRRPVLVAAGMPFGTPGTTNLLRVVFPAVAESAE